MSVSARHRDFVELACQNIGRAIKATNVRVFRSREPPIWSLGSSQAKLVKFDFGSGSNSKPCSIGGHQTGKVDQVEKDGFAELDKHKRTADHDERHPGKADRALWDCRDVKLGGLEGG